MAKLFVILLLLIFFTSIFADDTNTAPILTAAVLGQFCTQDTDCLGGGLICKAANGNCTYGECGCPNKYAFDYVALTCLPATALGMPCDNTTACRTLHSQCVNGFCACADGYRKRLSPDNLLYMCSPNTANGTYGKTCLDSSYCIPSLTCSSDTHTCSCDIGFTYTSNAKRYCAPKGVGDTCFRDEDCILSNSYCTDGTCQCAGGYQSFKWRVQFKEPLGGTYTSWLISACIGAVEPTFTTGQQCLTGLRRSVSKACDSNNICVPCNSNLNNTGYCVSMTEATGTFAAYSSVIMSSAYSVQKYWAFHIPLLAIIAALVN